MCSGLNTPGSERAYLSTAHGTSLAVTLVDRTKIGHVSFNV